VALSGQSNPDQMIVDEFTSGVSQLLGAFCRHEHSRFLVFAEFLMTPDIRSYNGSTAHHRF
jgi:hypothetical protein